jgi:hypothetical protein
MGYREVATSQRLSFVLYGLLLIYSDAHYVVEAKAGRLATELGVRHQIIEEGRTGFAQKTRRPYIMLPE